MILDRSGVDDLQSRNSFHCAATCTHARAEKRALADVWLVEGEARCTVPTARSTWRARASGRVCVLQSPGMMPGYIYKQGELGYACAPGYDCRPALCSNRLSACGCQAPASRGDFLPRDPDVFFEETAGCWCWDHDCYRVLPVGALPLAGSYMTAGRVSLAGRGRGRCPGGHWRVCGPVSGLVMRSIMSGNQLLRMLKRSSTVKCVGVDTWE